MKKELIAQRNPKSPIAEMFRTLRTNIQFMNSKNELKTILVTSTMPGEGKSWVSSNLAITFAQTGKRVCLIDADMRKGRLAKLFQIDKVPGLSNYLSGIDNKGVLESPDVLKYIKETEIDGLFLLPTGNVPPNPSELLGTETTVLMLENLKEIFDVIILDGTPGMLVTDALILSRIADTTILVASHKKTKKEDLEKVKRSIENVGGKIAGVVLNRKPVKAKEYSTSYYYGSSETFEYPSIETDVEEVLRSGFEEEAKQDEILAQLNGTMKKIVVEKEEIKEEYGEEKNDAVEDEIRENILAQLKGYLD